MPEEINRLVADQLSSLLFCPTSTAVENLKKEGITKGVFNTGDVMYDALIAYQKLANDKSQILRTLNIKPKTYLYSTVHRAENTDKKKNLKNILRAFKESGEHIIFPIHPRTKKMLKQFKISIPNNVAIIDPVGYLDNLQLISKSKKVLTDSGGIQKEAYILKVPCITLRNETEWVETVEDGWNITVGAIPEKIISAINNFSPNSKQLNYFVRGSASERITEILKSFGKTSAT